MEQKDTGLLIREKNAKLYRFYFNQAVRLIGIQCFYRAPNESGKNYNGNGELDTYFLPPIKVGVIFEEHPTVWTMRKLGWDTELQEGETLIHVPYDLKGLQSGGIFEVPSALDGTEPRLFRVLRMSTSMVYPSEVVCHIAPLWRNTSSKSQLYYGDNDFNLLNDSEEYYK